MRRWLLAFAVLAACEEDEQRNDRFRDDDAGGGGATAATTTTGGSGGSGGMGGATASSASTSAPASSSTGQTCNDPHPEEPNDTEATATYLGAIDDCDGSGMILEGVLPDGDVDWWTYDGIDDVGCVVDADRQLTSQGGSILVCKYFDCPGVAVTCPGGTSPDSSPSGLPGCCGTSSFNVAPNCTGLDESAYVFLRVEKQPIDPCVSYSIAFHY
jgi:hypothetical protein